MRAGILANSLPAALSVYMEVATARSLEAYILLSPSPGETGVKSVAKHLYRLFRGPGRLHSLKLILSGRVVLLTEQLDVPSCVKRIRTLDLDVGLHRSGTIYRQATIDAFDLGILNPHIGILPRYRGRSVLEWALIEDGPIGITVFFIDSGIDTGERIVLSEEVDISQCRSVDEAKQYLFDLDAVFFKRAIELLDGEDLRSKTNDGSGRRYYVVSKLFKELADAKLRGN
jgi:methionyl-tRNA formyltransferase